MSRYLVIAKITGVTDAGGSPVEYRKGTVVELTAGQVTTLGAANFRLVNNPGSTPQVTTYPSGGTSAFGIAAASGTHDTLGMDAGASN